MRRLTEQPLEGRTVEVLMLPRSLTHPPYQQQFQAQASHAGVALFAGFAENTAANDGGAPVAPTGPNGAASTDG
jgi:hypothetical protein